uniref:Uncharacterized protein n=1 Tax=Lotus japonicus TaxID=34305 RepID=I3S7X1_LOTJA|nr:unknown [Lotus japonicus]
MAASATTTFFSLPSIQNQHASLPTPFLGVPQCQSKFFGIRKKPPQKLVVVAVTKDSDEKVPSWAKPDSDEPPPWARDEANNKTASSSGFEVPFYVYLLASAITAIAAVGSIFEYVNQKPVFGLLPYDSVFYAPVLGFFAFTGIPSSSVQTANKEAEEQDKRDGYL